MKGKYQGSLADYRKRSDEELIHRYVHRNDQATINVLFERYAHLVLGVCLKYLRNGDQAKEATQQIFIKLLDDLPRFKIERFRPWLLQVTRNFCLMQLRGHVKVISTELDMQEDMESDDSLHQKVEQEYLYEQLDQALIQLNQEQRTCIELFYLQKLTYSEIAGRTGFSLGEVKSHLQNGKRNLKLKMEALAGVRK